jgi:nucleotide-binding universal stress UspA family protein
MSTFRAPLIAAAALTMVSCAAFAQVRVITPDSEHLYGADPRAPQQLPDDETLRLQNERADRARIQRIENARRQEELDAAAARAAAAGYEEQQSAQGGSYAGAFVSRQNRHANLRRTRGAVASSSSAKK